MKINHYIGIGVFILFVWSCTNPFSTRSPEEPNITGNQQSFNLQTDPDSLLSKIRNSFISMDVTDYWECLADSFQVGKTFVFIPEIRELNRLADWRLTDEENYFNNLINFENLQQINIRFFEESPWTIIASDTQQIQFSYQIDLQFRTKTENYQGRSLIKILRSASSLWYVFYWQDFKINSNDQGDTWSTLKANYRY